MERLAKVMTGISIHTGGKCCEKSGMLCPYFGEKDCIDSMLKDAYNEIENAHNTIGKCYGKIDELQEEKTELCVSCKYFDAFRSYCTLCNMEVSGYDESCEKAVHYTSSEGAHNNEA